MATKKTYRHHRDQFFKDHPRGRVLLGLFIVAVAFWVGTVYRNTKAQEFTVLGLQDENINLPLD